MAGEKKGELSETLISGIIGGNCFLRLELESIINV